MSIFERLFNRKKLFQDIEGIDQESLSEEEEEDLSEEEGGEDQPDGVEDSSEHGETEEEYEVVEREILPAKIICPDCGGITLEGLEFCDKCGGEL